MFALSLRKRETCFAEIASKRHTVLGYFCCRAPQGARGLKCPRFAAESSMLRSRALQGTRGLKLCPSPCHFLPGCGIMVLRRWIPRAAARTGHRSHPADGALRRGQSSLGEKRLSISAARSLGVIGRTLMIFLHYQCRYSRRLKTNARYYKQAHNVSRVAFR